MRSKIRKKVIKVAWNEMIMAIVVASLTSTGLWAFVSKLLDNKDKKTQLLIGLAHDRIMYLGMEYINRGSITRAEYDNLNTYLYKPYEKLGGNGSAERIMQVVNTLPFKED